MNEEKRLQQLKEIQVDTAKKERDFQQIAVRTNRKKFHWQVPAAVIGVLCIIVFLVASMPKQQMLTSENDEEPQLVAIYQLYGEGNPKSKWQMSVDEFTDQDELIRMEEFLSKLTLVEKSIREYEVIRYTYRLNYHDGTSRILIEYSGQTGPYYYDKTNDLIYSVGEDVVAGKIWLSNKTNLASSIVFIFIVIIVAVFGWFIDRKMRDPNDKKRSIPRHSTIKQSIVTIVLLLCTGLIMFIVPHIHYFYVVCMLFFLAAINIILETFHDNNDWRKMSFVVQMLWQAIFAYMIFW
ncbi:hypothetical protein [Solibacillus sp. FSL K6-1523]|uniref:hypothetical protein n=1 Tax=Solibacillus sp. FSL K6-1523 TaxID=2921471 RepID=UPI0030F79174